MKPATFTPGQSPSLVTPEQARLSVLGDRAVFSPCGSYRYLLTRELGGPRTVLFVMLNPSTADASADDPTLRRCIGFGRAWGLGRVEVVNLFAYRATKPVDMLARLRDGEDVVGPENDQHIVHAVERAERVVLGWGANAAHRLLRDRAPRVVELVRGSYRQEPPLCLRLTKEGCPEHPLMVPGAVTPVPYPGASRP